MPSHRKVSFAGVAGHLEGVLQLPANTPHAIAVVAHPLPIMGGTMDNKVVSTLARAFVELGYATLRFNFRGVGASDGSYDQGNGETLDAIAAAEFMYEEFPDLPLLLAGFSFGAYVQARAAVELQPQQLVLIAPAVGRFAMPDVPHDTLLIHGDMDEVVELHELLIWARPQHLPVIVLAGAEHFFHGRLTQLKQVVMRQLGAHL
ncbi:MAG: alpha/beta hydrolase [Gallionella sp.]